MPIGLPIWLKELLFRSERAPRYTNPRMVAYYWDGGAPKEHSVKNISSTGAYLCVTEPWYVGTVLMLTLQSEVVAGQDDSEIPFVSVSGRVVRHAPDGAGIQFMLDKNEERKALKQFMRQAALDRAFADRGQALLELVVVIPMLFLLIALALNFGTWLYGWVAVGNAARAAGDFAILSSSSAGLPPTATSSTLQALINTDLTYLPNVTSSNPAGCVQRNNNGTITKMMETPSGACATANTAYGSPPNDSEAKASGSTLTYPSVTVDITYTFTPFFLGSRILGLPLTVLPTTIHRRTVMRVL